MTIVRKIFGLCDSASFFADETEPPHFARKMVALAGKEVPVICYMGAAQGDNPDRIAEFERLMDRIGARSRILSLYNPPSHDAAGFFEGVDGIYVDGGSTRNLIALFREWDVVDIFREAYRKGVLIAGASAGLNLLFKWCITDSVKTELEPMPGLGMIDGSVCVHFDSQLERQDIFRTFLQGSDAHFPAYALDDGSAVYFENERLSDCIAIRPDAGIVEYQLGEGGLTDQVLSITRLQRP
ncbi:MAG: Type 1 glutamine amidotransferase-like domain-containing protein [Pseudomonadota bacterium]